MKGIELLAVISRNFLQIKKVNRYGMKKVADMTDKDVIKYCHWYCEDNRLNDEWYEFREKAEAEYLYCSYLEEYIDEGLCCDLQMISESYIKPSALPEVNIDKEKCRKCCLECRYSL